MQQIGTKLYIKVMEGLLDILFALSLSGDEWVVEPRVAKFLKNAGLILTSKFEGFWGFILKKPQSFLPEKPQNFHPQPQKCCPHPHLSFLGFLRVNLK